MIRIAVPAVTVLVVVASYVALAGWNRSAAPQQVIEVTEREASLRDVGDHAAIEDDLVQLALEIEPRADPLDARNWLSEDRLRALGFTLDVPPGAPEASDAYRRVPPRVGWVVLEYDGPAFVEIERRRALRRQKDREPTGPWRDRLEPSRLVPVDAGPAFAPLRAAYPANHLIVRAVIGLVYLGPREHGPLLYGTLRQIIPSRISVPRHLRQVLTTLPSRVESPPDAARTAAPPRYHAELASGPLGILYVRGIRLP